MRHAVIAASLLLLPLAIPAHAQDDVLHDVSRRAVDRSAAGDHVGAVDLYLQAYTLVPDPDLLARVGDELALAGKPVAAARYYCLYLEREPAGTSAAHATARVRELGGACAERLPEQRGRTLRAVGIGAGAVGVLAIGTGIIYGHRAKTISDQIHGYGARGDAWPANIHELEARGQRYEDRELRLLVAGGALIAGGAITYLVGRARDKRAESLVVAPIATSDRVGVTIGSAF